jgi:hypothetical protein
MGAFIAKLACKIGLHAVKRSSAVPGTWYCGRGCGAGRVG